MTRINCVPVECLTNPHLLGEYKEIARPLRKASNRIKKHGSVGEIVCNYRLGAGHETFFFNKAIYILNRRRQLYNQMLFRGMNPDAGTFIEIQKDYERLLLGTDAWNDWQPTPEDMYLNMSRLVERHYE